MTALPTICYTFQSSTAVLAVWCTRCGQECNYGYSERLPARWTERKEHLLCDACARRHEEAGGVCTEFARDLPFHRCQLRWIKMSDCHMFSNWSSNPRTSYWRWFADRPAEFTTPAPPPRAWDKQ
jgi:hypothetical protein